MIPNRCVQCTKPFSARVHAGIIQRFCGKRCARIFDHPRRVSALLANSGRKRGKTTFERKCRFCDAPFHVFSADPQVYCKKTCADLAYSAASEERAQRLLALGVKTCLHCQCEMPLRLFPKDGGARSNGTPTCRACISVRRRTGHYPVILPRSHCLFVGAGAIPFTSPNLVEIYQRYWLLRLAA